MRRALTPTLLLAVATLSVGAELPAAPRLAAGLADHTTLTECKLLKRLFCTKANQIAENNELNTWHVFDDYGVDYDEYEDKAPGTRRNSLGDIHRWLYPSQFAHLQRGFQRLYKPYINPRDQPRIRYYQKEASPDLKVVYLRNKNVFIENDQTYYVYDTYIGTVNPFDFMSARFLCRAAADGSPASYDDAADCIDIHEEISSEETNEINPVVKDSVEKRVDVLDVGQKEVPDNLDQVHEDDKGKVRKKLFALWSRMQSLTPKGRQLPMRRHTFMFYGRDGALSAETRAAHLRPPGQPLRWG